MIEFHGVQYSSITLIGMSGAGKTHISSMLADHGWSHFSADYEIGRNHLKKHVDQNDLTPENIRAISKFIGKLGHPDKGGLPYDVFKERQRLYHDAERRALYDVLDLSNTENKAVINDTSGSFCELDDQQAYDALAKQSLYVYLDAYDDKDTLIQRGIDYPKPMYFPPDFLDEHVALFVNEENISHINKADPDKFASWVFPRLFEARLPKYQYLANKYGVTIPTHALKNATKAQDFLDLVGKALHKKTDIK